MMGRQLRFGSEAAFRVGLPPATKVIRPSESEVSSKVGHGVGRMALSRVASME